MRLSKRVAVGILTSILAVSLMTACGGGGGGTPNGNGNQKPSNSGASSGSTENGDDTDNSGSSGKDDGNNLENPSAMTSRTVKYFMRQVVDGKNRYIRYYNESDDWEVEQACDGNRSYNKGIGSTASERWVVNFIRDRAEGKLYEVDTKHNEIRSEDIDINNWTESSTGKTVRFIPVNMKEFYWEPGTKTVHGVEYYCERTFYYAYCFDKDDTEGLKLKYVVEEAGSGMDFVYEIKEVSPKFDPELLRIPENYKLYYNDKYIGVTGKDNYPN